MKNYQRAILGLVSAFVISCAPESSPKLLPEARFPKEDISEKPAEFEVFKAKVDILFVIDSSGSMQSAQSILAKNAADFATSIGRATFLDYHIGVIDSDMMYSHCDTACGKLQGEVRYVTRTTPNMANVLARNIMVGTNGSGQEMMFQPVQAALSNPLETTHNQGFYRQDAFLALIFLTDAAEQSGLRPGDFFKFLIDKKLDKRKVLGYGVIRKYQERNICRSPDEDSTPTPVIEEFLAMVDNGGPSQPNVLSLCSPDYGVRLAEFARDIATRATGRVKLKSIPITSTIKVTYGTQEIPNSPNQGWMYEASTNSILLAEGIKWIDQGPNVSLRVDFKTYKDED